MSRLPHNKPRSPDETAAYARAWLRADPDPTTRLELAGLLGSGHDAELDDRFNSRIVFGTSGLRGPRGAGPNRMNRLVIAHAVTAIMRHLSPPTVVIGYDARHQARDYANEAAAMVADQGGLALVMPEPLPTPVMVYAFRHYGADAGLIITASHNPADDAGCKVYLGDGAQLVPPHDRQIEQLMADLADPPIYPHAGQGGQVSRVRSKVIDSYLDVVVPDKPHPAIGDLRVAYTALHGVAGHVFCEAMTRIGASAFVVEGQFAPDPDFPTVVFPNPEEPRSLDAVIAKAVEVDADVALANDPDGDRLGVVVPEGDHWLQLNGDQIGILLGDYCLRHSSGPGRVTAATAVSSRMLSVLSAAHDVPFIETLHGFKYVARAADDQLETRLLFGYEPALGYAVNGTIRDKDGISAAIVFLSLMAEQRSVGKSVLHRLDELAVEHGVHTTAQLAIWFEGLGAPQRMSRAMDAVRANPPASIDGRIISTTTDFRDQADMLRFDLEDGSRVQLRPSGTEPKLKAYIELVKPVGPGERVADVRAKAQAERENLVAEVRLMLAEYGAS